ncbi:MAG: hypothetical protein M1834_003550 [Cirrosporium novae-zelandiae]|nr:MAG: hypothetical protein M1834_003550 [Cirrosporium novae-zelandiae]
MFEEDLNKCGLVTGIKYTTLVVYFHCMKDGSVNSGIFEELCVRCMLGDLLDKWPYLYKKIDDVSQQLGIRLEKNQEDLEEYGGHNKRQKRTRNSYAQGVLEDIQAALSEYENENLPLISQSKRQCTQGPTRGRISEKLAVIIQSPCQNEPSAQRTPATPRPMNTVQETLGLNTSPDTITRSRGITHPIAFRMYHGGSAGHNSPLGFRAGLYQNVHNVIPPIATTQESRRTMVYDHMTLLNRTPTPFISLSTNLVPAIHRAFRQVENPSIAILDLALIRRTQHTWSGPELLRTNGISLPTGYNARPEWLVWGEVQRQAVLGTINFQELRKDRRLYQDVADLLQWERIKNTKYCRYELRNALKANAGPLDRSAGLVVRDLLRWSGVPPKWHESIGCSIAHDWKLSGYKDECKLKTYTDAIKSGAPRFLEFVRVEIPSREPCQKYIPSSISENSSIAPRAVGYLQKRDKPTTVSRYPVPRSLGQFVKDNRTDRNGYIEKSTPQTQDNARATLGTCSELQTKSSVDIQVNTPSSSKYSTCFIFRETQEKPLNCQAQTYNSPPTSTEKDSNASFTSLERVTHSIKTPPIYPDPTNSIRPLSTKPYSCLNPNMNISIRPAPSHSHLRSILHSNLKTTEPSRLRRSCLTANSGTRRETLDRWHNEILESDEAAQESAEVQQVENASTTVRSKEGKAIGQNEDRRWANTSTKGIQVYIQDGGDDGHHCETHRCKKPEVGGLNESLGLGLTPKLDIEVTDYDQYTDPEFKDVFSSNDGSPVKTHNTFKNTAPVIANNHEYEYEDMEMEIDEGEEKKTQEHRGTADRQSVSGDVPFSFIEDLESILGIGTHDYQDRNSLSAVPHSNHDLKPSSDAIRPELPPTNPLNHSSFKRMNPADDRSRIREMALLLDLPFGTPPHNVYHHKGQESHSSSSTSLPAPKNDLPERHSSVQNITDPNLSSSQTTTDSASSISPYFVDTSPPHSRTLSRQPATVPTRKPIEWRSISEFSDVDAEGRSTKYTISVDVSSSQLESPNHNNNNNNNNNNGRSARITKAGAITKPKPRRKNQNQNRNDIIPSSLPLPHFARIFSREATPVAIQRSLWQASLSAESRSHNPPHRTSSPYASDGSQPPDTPCPSRTHHTAQLKTKLTSYNPPPTTPENPTCPCCKARSKPPIQLGKQSSRYEKCVCQHVKCGEDVYWYIG